MSKMMKKMQKSAEQGTRSETVGKRETQNIPGMMNVHSKPDQPIFKQLNIALDDIEPNERNNASMQDIDSLAESIKRVGLHSPIEVERKPGTNRKYIIIGGERRWRAFRKLYEEGNTKFAYIPALIRTMPDDYMPEDFDQAVLDRYNIVVTNKEVRDKTPEDVLEIIQASTDFYNELKRVGTDLDESCRKFIARQLNMSEDAIRRYNRIDRSVIPELKDLWKKGKLRQDAAYAIRTCTPEEQQHFYELVCESEEVIDIDTVEDYKQSLSEKTVDGVKGGGERKKTDKKKILPVKVNAVSLTEYADAIRDCVRVELPDWDDDEKRKYNKAVKALKKNIEIIQELMKSGRG